MVLHVHLEFSHRKVDVPRISVKIHHNIRGVEIAVHNAVTWVMALTPTCRGSSWEGVVHELLQLFLKSPELGNRKLGMNGLAIVLEAWEYRLHSLGIEAPLEEHAPQLRQRFLRELNVGSARRFEGGFQQSVERTRSANARATRAH